MITQLLEKKIVDAVSAALAAVGNLPKFQVFGVWQPSAVGVVKNEEESDAVATVAVATSLPQSTSFSTGEVAFSGALALTVRIDLDPTGTALVAFAEPLEALLKAWQADAYQRPFTALDVPGISIDEVSIGTGNPPAVNLAKRVVSVSLPFTLSGSYRDTTNQQQTTNNQ